MLRWSVDHKSLTS